MKKVVTCEYDADNGLFWVATYLGAYYLGGEYKDAGQVEEIGFDSSVHERQVVGA